MIFGSQLSVCVFLFPVICQFSKNSFFQKRGAKFGFFIFQCFKLNFEKSLFLGLLKHYKSRDFCEIRLGLLDFLSQDGSDGEVSLLLSCHPGLHDHCQKMSWSLSLVDGCSDSL